MKKILILSSSLVLMAGCATTDKPDIVCLINQDLENSPTAAGGGAGENWARGYILVQPRAGLASDKFDEIVRGKGGRSLGRIANLPVHKIAVPENAEDAVVRALSKNPSIKFAEKDMLVAPDEFIPNDSKYTSEWHLPIIQAPEAWALSQGDGVVVAVLDTGVYGAHPDLSSKMLDGWNVVSNDTDTSDIMGHGTAVAGFVGAASNNLIGVASVGFNAQIMPVRITNRSDGAAYYSDIAKGLNWAANNGAKIANISFVVVNSSSVSTAAQYMRNKGGVVVSGSGNSNVDLGSADNPYIIVAAATTSNDTKASFSNYGDYVDISAPGAGVLTTNRSGGYNSWSGTSFSSPITAGVAALVMSANPNLSPDQVEMVLESSADDLISGVDWHVYYGHGRVNAAAAVQMALNTPAEDSQAPVVTVFAPGKNALVKGSVSVEVSATDNTGVNEVSLYANGVLVATDITTPYQFSWDSTQEFDGLVTLSATAVDASLNEGVSSDLTVEVQNTVLVEDVTAPTVVITNPVDGEAVKRTVSINVDALDDVQVAEIQLMIDGEVVNSDITNSISYSWNTRKVASGIHVISAIATDTSGNVSQLAVVSVTIGGDSTTTTKTKGRK